MDKLSNLHLLLRVPSFSRLPLQVRFFCEDVYEKWQAWNEKVGDNIRGGIKVLLDLKEPRQIIDDSELPMSTHAKGKRKREAVGKGGIEGLDVGYSNLKNHIEKSISFLADFETPKCAVCAEKLDPRTAVALVCPRMDCRTASHMACLATKFIKNEGAGFAITPISGRCPGCKEEFQWIDLIKESSLRIRGEKEVAKITKMPKERKIKTPKMKDAVTPQPEARLYQGGDADPDEDSATADMRAMDASDDSLPDDWQYQIEDDDGVISLMSGNSAVSDDVEAANSSKRSSGALKLPPVIEDSELDEAEFSN